MSDDSEKCGTPWAPRVVKSKPIDEKRSANGFAGITETLSLRMPGNRTQSVLAQFTSDVESTGASVAEYATFANDWPKKADKFPTYREMWSALCRKAETPKNRTLRHCLHDVCEGDGLVIVVDGKENEIAVGCDCPFGHPFALKNFIRFEDAKRRGWRQAEWQRNRKGDRE